MSDFAVAGIDGYPQQLSILAERYTIEHVLGTGGMARVYRAYDLRMQRPVAVKLLQRGLRDTAARRQRFNAEIEMLSALDVEGVVDVYDRGEFGGWLWYVMPYIDGQELGDYVASVQPSIGHRLAMAERLASALAGLHHAGLTHRDLKPANVMVRADGMPLLMDFGIAKWEATSRRLDLTEDGEVPGTPLYMAPERFNSKESQLDSRSSDIFALGILLYELLTETYPFGSKDVNLTVHVLRLMDTDILPASDLNPEIPADAASIVGQCLERLAGDRPDAETVAATLRQVLQDYNAGLPSERLGVPTASLGQVRGHIQPPTLRSLPAKTLIRSGLLVGGLFVVLLGGGISAIWLHFANQPPAALPPVPPPVYVPVTISTVLDGGATPVTDAIILLDGVPVETRSPATIKVREGHAVTLQAHKSGYFSLLLSEPLSFTPTEDHDNQVTLSLVETKKAIIGLPWSDLNTELVFSWMPGLKAWISTYETTNAAYLHFAPEHDSGEITGPIQSDAEPRTYPLNRPQQPVVRISYNDAVAYADWLTQRYRAADLLPEGYRVRLPTIEEWEHVAKCGEDSRTFIFTYPGVTGNWDGGESRWSDAYPDASATWFYEHYEDEIVATQTVQSTWANEWDIYGMAGNAAELVEYGEDDETAVRKGGHYQVWSWDGMKTEYNEVLPVDYADDVTTCRLILALDPVPVPAQPPVPNQE